MDREGRVTAIRQAVEACAYGQAAAALMAGRAIGSTRESAQGDLDAATRWLKGDGEAQWLAVLEPALTRPSRHEAILLPFRALVAALNGTEG
jgi:NifU-like protein involved in Fe-S cluster formation